jgi:hypothetical protein
MLKLLQKLLTREKLLRRLGPVIGDFNPFLPEYTRDPYPTFKHFREEEPIFFSRVFGAHFVTRYDDCVEMLRSPQTSADRRDTLLFRAVRWFNRNEPEFSAFFERNLLMLEDQDHRRLRGLISKAFTPRRVEALRPRLEAVAEDLLDNVAPGGSIELIADFAYPFPLIAIAELLGVPREDHSQFRRWTAGLVQILDPLQGSDGARPMRQATRDLFAYFRPLLAARRAEPRDDLLSAMIHAEDAGDQLDENDLLALCTLVLAAGHETTANLVGNAVVALLRHPEQRKRLVEDPGLLPTAVDEFLRFDSPIQFTDRAIAEDFELGGQHFRKGQFVGILLASANRDADQFENPDSLDVGRDPNPHLALSHGAHFCLGAQLARMETEIALGALLRRYPDFTGEPEAVAWRRSSLLRGPVAVPLNL